MSVPTEQDIEKLLDKLTSEEDRRVLLGLQALLLAAQTQTVIYAKAMDVMASTAGSIGMDINQATTKLKQHSATGTKGTDESLKAIQKAYTDANNGVKGGMAAASEFIETYKAQSEREGVDAGKLFKEVTSGFLNAVLPSAGSLFDILTA